MSRVYNYVCIYFTLPLDILNVAFKYFLRELNNGIMLYTVDNHKCKLLLVYRCCRGNISDVNIKSYS